VLFQVPRHNLIARGAGHRSKLGVIAGVHSSIGCSVALRFMYSPVAQSYGVKADT
jgi:hypothetical protein